MAAFLFSGICVPHSMQYSEESENLAESALMPLAAATALSRLSVITWSAISAWSMLTSLYKMI